MIASLTSFARFLPVGVVGLHNQVTLAAINVAMIGAANVLAIAWLLPAANSAPDHCLIGARTPSINSVTEGVFTTVVFLDILNTLT